MYLLAKIPNIFNEFNLLLGRAISWLVLAMVLLTATTVIQRYLFASNYVWESELIIYMHSILFLGSAGYSLQTNSHVRVDVLYERFSQRTKAIFDLIGALFFLLPVCVAINYFSYDFIMSSWEIKEKSREYSGLPVVYLLKSCIFLFTLTLFTQSIPYIQSCTKQIK